MQVYRLVRCSRSLVRAYTPSVVHFSTVASKPPGANISSGGPEPNTSYRVRMPSRIAVAMASHRGLDGHPALDLPSRAHVVGVGADRLQGDPRDVGVGLDLRIQRARRVADGGVDHAHS